MFLHILCHLIKGGPREVLGGPWGVLRGPWGPPRGPQGRLSLLGVALGIPQDIIYIVFKGVLQCFLTFDDFIAGVFAKGPRGGPAGVLRGPTCSSAEIGGSSGRSSGVLRGRRWPGGHGFNRTGGP